MMNHILNFLVYTFLFQKMDYVKNTHIHELLAWLYFY